MSMEIQNLKELSDKTDELYRQLSEIPLNVLVSALNDRIYEQIKYYLAHANDLQVKKKN